MAVGRSLKQIVFFSTAGSSLLGLVAVFICNWADPYDPAFMLPNHLMWWSLLGAFPWGTMLLALQVTWLGVVDGWEPSNVKLLFLIAVEWVIACFTFGVSCAALAVDQLAIQIQYDHCINGAAVCSLYLVAAGIACAAGALAAVSALGMLWILASRFRPVHAA